jgi:transposase
MVVGQVMAAEHGGLGEGNDFPRHRKPPTFSQHGLDREFRDVAADDALEADIGRSRRLAADGTPWGRIAAILGRPRGWAEMGRDRLRRCPAGAGPALDRQAQPTDPTDPEWEVARQALGIPDPRVRGRGRPATDRRPVVNAIRHRQATGRGWHDLPAHYPRWRLVQRAYKAWKTSGAWGRMEAALAERRAARADEARPGR